MSEENVNKDTFESAYKKLDGIVNRMEKESLDLEEALKAYEEGRKTVAVARQMSVL